MLLALAITSNLSVLLADTIQSLTPVAIMRPVNEAIVRRAGLPVFLESLTDEEVGALADEALDLIPYLPSA
ncbi:MAG: hypothetical protein AAB407_01140 [Patescibacteria group bacterium]